MENQEDQLKDWNCLLSFLAESNETRTSAPLVILAGNCLPILADKAAALYLNGQVEKIFLVGGIGHATKFLRKNFANQGILFNEEQSESEMYFHYLTNKYHIPDEVFILETNSTNSGENAQNSLEILRSKGKIPESILLMNDPTLQRRTKATFEKVWQKEKVNWINYVPIIPKIIELNPCLRFVPSALNEQWPKEYFYSLVLGEMIRLNDDEHGYGPKGKNYMNHVDIPSNVWDAYQRISSTTNGSFLRT
ncbi:hypothetical protein BH747_01565 [Enterococcus villorum]|uniref:DUF218 domain-containing protein n=1 Tax=Enterococcus villorum TaxID=112904 RepID=A0A1V8YMA4_9ENTE|nr:YdcF family protein [Enterococcus villorum]OQO71546.1 hypothetical protein BH747_01565 [Enterococcus villorum]OQO73658.1 hypothetical protein BH744_09305 [Enterococcus villorum]